MSQLTFDQFIHPSSEFPNVVNLNDSDEPMLDVYTMASLILYSACANNHLDATNYTFSTSTANMKLIDVQSLFDRCKMGDQAAILKMTTMIVTGLEQKLENVGRDIVSLDAR